jgi:hypothetical protein
MIPYRTFFFLTNYFDYFLKLFLELIYIYPLNPSMTWLFPSQFHYFSGFKIMFMSI